MTLPLLFCTFYKVDKESHTIKISPYYTITLLLPSPTYTVTPLSGHELRIVVAVAVAFSVQISDA
jgi:hypothetical protein